MIEFLRTPDERFDDLPDFPFAPNYVTLPSHGLRMHYVDEGDATEGKPTFLCLHGQPSWSYLYRKMIPIFAKAGRVIAPDLLGFGRSDKPVDEAVYGFEFHRDALLSLIEALDLHNITLVCQDWGGLIGLTLPIAMPDRFSRLIVMNTALATGDVKMSAGFAAWQAYNRSQPDLDVAALMQSASPILTPQEAAAYGAPFPDLRYKAGVRKFPDLVPAGLDASGAILSRQARDWWGSSWAGKSFMAVGCQDKVITPAMMAQLRTIIKGCPEPMLLPEAGHFVQEWGVEIAEQALAYFAAN
jgi:haloalkane dehalogenase